MVDAKRYSEVNKVVKITIDPPIILLSKSNISVFTFKVPQVNPTKDNLTPYLCH